MLFVDHASHGVRRCNLARRIGCRRDLRQAEIENLGVTPFGDKNIRRLNVAMNDALRVSGVERIGDVNGDGEKNLRFERSPRKAVLQGQPLQKLHDDERLTILLPDFIDRADIGMVESRRRLRLALEAGQGLGVFYDVIGQKLQGDKSVQGYVLGLVNNPHTAAAELLDDAVVRDGFSDHGED